MSIGVILCTYNGEKFIQEQLESILNQTFKVDEIHIYDDGSTDKTIEIILEFILLHPEQIIKVFKNERNLGYSKNFLTAIKKSNFDFYFLSDQDDIWRRNKVELMLPKLRCNTPSLVFSDADLLFKGKNSFMSLFEVLKIRDLDTVTTNDLLKRNVVTGCVTAFNDSLASMLEKYDLETLSDIPHDYVLSLLAGLNGQLIKINIPLVLYRQHENNQIGLNTNLIKKIKKLNFKFDDYVHGEINRSKVMCMIAHTSKYDEMFSRRLAFYQAISKKGLRSIFIILKDKEILYSFVSKIKLAIMIIFK